MLANIARQSVKSAYSHGDGSWSNTSCWEFNGTNSISAVVAEALPLPSEDELTIACWVKFGPVISASDSTGIDNISSFPVSFLGTSTENLTLQRMTGFYLVINPYKKLLISRHNDPTNSSNYTLINLLSYPGLNTWEHIAVTYKRSTGTIAFYTIRNTGNPFTYSTSDGKVGSEDFGLPDTITEPFYLKIGSNQYNAGFQIAELGIWKEALSADSITKLQEAPIDLKSNSGNYTSDNVSNLQAYYRFGDGVNDNAAYGVMSDLLSDDQKAFFADLLDDTDDMFDFGGNNADGASTLIDVTDTPDHGFAASGATFIHSSGYGLITNTGGAQGIVTLGFSTPIAGRAYNVHFDWISGNSHVNVSIGASAAYNSTNSVTTTAADITYSLEDVFVATGATTYLAIQLVSSTINEYANIDNLQIRQAPWLNDEEGSHDLSTAVGLISQIPFEE